jgi:sugar lactone lactonase YvrE
VVSVQPEIVAPGRYQLAEGARWVDGRLVFVDITAGRLYELTDGGPRLLVDLDVPLGAVAPVHGQPGTWIAAADTGIALLDTTGGVEWLARPEDGAPQPRRMNDGVCDPAGRFWAGSMAFDETEGNGALFRVDPDATVTRVIDAMTIPNGPAFSADGRLMYLADSVERRIWAYDLDPVTGELGERRDFATIDGANPDGMTLDAEGRLWNAVWGGSRVTCYRPDGTTQHTIELPARQPTSVCLADGALFETTAAVGLDDPHESDGAVLRLPVDAAAPPASAFRLSR